MKKVLLILLVSCGMVFSLPAQDIRTLFVEAPDSVLPLLSRNARADCLDFADAGMDYPVTNMLNGKSVIKELADDYLLLQSSGSSTIEIRLLPCNGEFVICVVNTVFAEVADSRIAFFDNRWNRLPVDVFFTPPSISDFLTSDNDEVLDKCDMYLVSLKMVPAENIMVADYTMPGYMNSDDAIAVRPFLKKINYRWNSNRFVME